MVEFEQKVKQLDVNGLIIASIMSALGLAVGLMWKDTIMETIKVLAPEGNGLFFMYISSTIVTVAIVIVAYILIKGSQVINKAQNRMIKEFDEMKKQIVKQDNEIKKQNNIIKTQQNKMKKVEKKL